MKTLLLLTALVTLLTAGCATRNHAQGGTYGGPKYDTGRDQYPPFPARDPSAWEDEKFPHAQHF